MADRFIQTHIQRLPLFQAMTPAQLDEVARAFQVLRLAAGEVVFYEGHPTQGLYLFAEGQGAFYQLDAQRAQQLVGTVELNQYIGEAALFSEDVEAATLQALQPSTVLFLSRGRFLDLISHHPEIKSGLPGMSAGAAPAPASESTFPGQRDNEIVLAQRRAHWWAFGYYGLIATIISVILVVLAIIVPTALVTLIFFLLAVLAPLIIVPYAYFEWRNDNVIISDQRVIRISKTIITFETKISEVQLDSVHEVSYEIPPNDPFARIFHYGTVEIKTPSQAANMRLTRIPDPTAVQKIIFENRERYRQRGELQRRDSIRAELDRMLSGHPAQQEQVAHPQEAPGDSRWSHILPTQMRLSNPNGDTVFRKHYLVWLRHIFPPFVLLLLAITLFFLSFFDTLGVGLVTFPVSIVLGLIAFAWFYWADWDWRNDLYIVSDETITLIHRRPLWLQNEIDQIRLDRVENVVSQRRGLLNNLFDVGEVRLSLVGGDTEDAKIMSGAHKPQEVQAEISQRQARAKAREQEADVRRQQQTIAEYLTVYHEQQNDAPTQAPPQQSPQPSQQPQQPQRPFGGARPPGIPRVRRDPPE